MKEIMMRCNNSHILPEWVQWHVGYITLEDKTPAAGIVASCVWTINCSWYGYKASQASQAPVMAKNRWLLTMRLIWNLSKPLLASSYVSVSYIVVTRHEDWSEVWSMRCWTKQDMVDFLLDGVRSAINVLFTYWDTTICVARIDGNDFSVMMWGCLISAFLTCPLWVWR
jgi:hypothetical protein